MFVMLTCPFAGSSNSKPRSWSHSTETLMTPWCSFSPAQASSGV